MVQDASPEEVYRCPTSALAARLTGPAGVLQGTAQGDRASTELGTFSLAQPHTGEVTLIVRPEEARFTPGPDGPAVVAWRRFAGRATLLGIGPLIVEWIDEAPPALGTRGQIELLAPAWAVPA